MSLANSRLAYLDCYTILDKAIESPTGYRIKVESVASAIHFRMRIHQARKLEREKNKDVYQPLDPQYGASAWDGLVCRIKPERDCAWVYIEKFATRILAVGEIPEDECLPEPVELKLIEHKPALEEPPTATPITRRRLG